MEPPLEPTRRPPDSVAYIARSHWLVGGVALVSIALLHAFTRNLPTVSFDSRMHGIAAAAAVFYLATGTMVWFGTPLGRACSFVCSLLYLVRPQLGDRVWRISRSEEYRAHFERRGL
jgi:hypothetical protein